MNILVYAAELTMDELKFAAAVLNPEIMVHAPRSDAGEVGMMFDITCPILHCC
jgi:hypothetical protein